MWFIKPRYLTNSMLDDFLDQYKNVPGILDVQDDGIKRDLIIIFFDSKKLPKHSLPKHFNGFLLHLYDVRKMFRDTKQIVSRVNVNNLTNEKSQNIYAQVIQTMNLCEVLLKRKGISSEVSTAA
jgi:hypothetical protein